MSFVYLRAIAKYNVYKRTLGKVLLVIHTLSYTQFVLSYDKL
jgi:hypothetical protein